MEFDAVILAAGAGARYGKSGGKLFKQVVPYKGVPVIERIVAILQETAEIAQILVVLGDNAECAEAIRNALSGRSVVYRYNLQSSTDNNLISFGIGTKGLKKGVILIEADCIFEPEDIANVLSVTGADDVCWANIGSIESYDHGGVVELDDEGGVDGVDVFDQEQMAIFKEENRKGLKLFGIAAFGVEALQSYRTQMSLFKPKKKIYFHAIAIEYPNHFHFKTVKMTEKSFSFNVVDEFVDE